MADGSTLQLPRTAHHLTTHHLTRLQRHHGGQEGRRPQDRRREPQGPARILHHRHLGSRPHADGHRGQVAAQGAVEHRRELCLVRGRRHVADQLLHPRAPGVGQFFQHEPRRKRKLLLRKPEMHKLAIAVERKGMTIVPLELYFNARGIAKLKLALAEGKKLHDKRDSRKEARLEPREGAHHAREGLSADVATAQSAGRRLVADPGAGRRRRCVRAWRAAMLPSLALVATEWVSRSISRAWPAGRCVYAYPMTGQAGRGLCPRAGTRFPARAAARRKAAPSAIILRRVEGCRAPITCMAFRRKRTDYQQ